MAYKKRTDANQSEIVSALRKVGASVLDLSKVGHSCPDLLVGFRGKNYLLEIKDGAKKPSARKLRDNQVEFFAAWLGQVAKAESVDDALRAIGAIH